MLWITLHPSMTHESLGFVPGFLDENDPRPAAVQFDRNYIGGWHPMAGFTLESGQLYYPGDPPLLPLAETRLRDEIIRLYEYEWVVVIQPDGSFQVSRMD
jgi:hypothetical protein